MQVSIKNIINVSAKSYAMQTSANISLQMTLEIIKLISNLKKIEIQ